MPASGTALLWLRRDLRLHDHPALTRALAEHARVVPVFVLDPGLLEGRYASPPRTAFMLACLRELDAELRARGSGLVVRSGKPVDEICRLAGDVGARSVLWTSEPGPYAMRRDRRAREQLSAQGVEVVPNPGSFCADINLPRTYEVFAPFHRVHAGLPRRDVLGAPDAMPALPDDLPRGTLPEPEQTLAQPIREPGERAARAAAGAWLAGPVDLYAELHHSVAGGTSELSPYVRWGCVSARELEQRARDRGGSGAAAFARQLAWRDFHGHVLLRHPENLETTHHRQFASLEFDDAPDRLDAWTEGRTGFPLVDAGMRQLKAQGWMHNRARLTVGSFLAKDLHLDWRLGETHFERLLLDGEPAQNDGNWQWISSVGIDHAPFYKRMLNPQTQLEKFDPDGAYVRRWIPELEGVDDPAKLTPALRRDRGYPMPIVDHAAERKRAIDRYAAVAG